MDLFSCTKKINNYFIQQITLGLVGKNIMEILNFTICSFNFMNNYTHKNIYLDFQQLLKQVQQSYFDIQRQE